MPLDQQWPRIRRVFSKAFNSSLHYAIATVAPDGTPHVTPIGSILLLEPGRAIYFEEFTTRMPAYFRENSRVCVLAVNSGRWFWLGALLRGRFRQPPAIRLLGSVGVRRQATAAEFARWRRRVRLLGFTRGYTLLWSRMCMVRELHFTEVDAVNLGAMTAGLVTGTGTSPAD